MCYTSFGAKVLSFGLWASVFWYLFVGMYVFENNGFHGIKECFFCIHMWGCMFSKNLGALKNWFTASRNYSNNSMWYIVFQTRLRAVTWVLFIFRTSYENRGG